MMRTMVNTPWMRAGGALLAGLWISACEDSGTDTGDAGPDAGMTDTDAGMTDTDAGMTETDAGPMTRPDAGFARGAQEGRVCQIREACDGIADQAQLAACLNQDCHLPEDTAAERERMQCIPNNGAEREGICMRLCLQGSDCTDPEIGSSKGNTLCAPAYFGVVSACVTATVAEGEIADILEPGGAEGCDFGLTPIPAQGGLTGLAVSQYSCVRACDPGAQSQCGTDYPYCNPQVLAGLPESWQVPSGVCSARLGQDGDPCSTVNAALQCDTNAVDDVQVVRQCVPSTALPFQQVIDPADDPGAGLSGTCLSFCDPTVETSTTTGLPTSCDYMADSGSEASCVQYTVDPNFGEIGICSHNCEIDLENGFSDSCDREGAYGAGSRCGGGFGFQGGLEGESLSLCTSVVTPVISETDDWQTIDAEERCDQQQGDAARCESGTLCLSVGAVQQGCFRVCDSSTVAATTGCEGNALGNTLCDDSLVGEAADGVGLCIDP